jgi:hypothetical protein
MRQLGLTGEAHLLSLKQGIKKVVIDASRKIRTWDLAVN